jgi:hypothetical protein
MFSNLIVLIMMMLNTPPPNHNTNYKVKVDPRIIYKAPPPSPPPYYIWINGVFKKQWNTDDDEDYDGDSS